MNDDARSEDDRDEEADDAEGGTDAHGMPRVLPTIFPGPPSWPTVFGRAAPLELELGFGRPHFLFERAAEVPDHDVVGIEWKGRWVEAARKRQLRDGTPNLRALHGNAWLLAGALFRPGSLDAIWLNFPDPWWKTKHKKRRIVSDAFAATVASLLKVGGRVVIQTDVASLLEEQLARLEEVDVLENPHGRGRLAPKKPMRARSHREKRVVADGVPVFRAVVERRR